MSKVWYKLEDIEDFEHTAANFFKASYAPTLAENAATIDLWTDDDFKDVFDMQSEKSILLKETDDAWGSFKNKYSHWIARNGALIANEAYTLFMKYNPIHNYDRHEVHSGDDTATKTPDDWVLEVTETPDEWKRTETFVASNDYKSKDTQVPTQWEKTSETIGNDTDNAMGTENKVIPFDGTDFANVSKTLTVTSHREKETQSGTYAMEHTQEGTHGVEVTEEGKRTTTTEQKGTFEDKTEYGHIIDVSGNIGVTTTATMIREILDLYDHDFICRWLSRFFNAYCAYVR